MIDFPLRSGALLLLWFILLGVVMPMTSNKSGVMGRRLASVAIVVCGLVWLQPRMPDTVTSQNAQLSLAVEPLNAQSWLRYAAAAGEQSDQVQVTKRLLQTTTISPSNPWAWLALARQYARQGLDDKAALAWQNFLTVPLAERQKGYIEEALDVGVQAIPDVAPVTCVAAGILARRDRRLDASLLFLQASERMPSCADSHGRWLARWKLPDMALQVTEERASCLALKVRGRAYRQLNQLTDAAKAYALASDVCDHDDPTLSAERAALIAE
jgi:tetratricopeptide (TPR) repeat protein